MDGSVLLSVEGSDYHQSRWTGGAAEITLTLINLGFIPMACRASKTCAVAIPVWLDPRRMKSIAFDE